jgi:hypothetical protein
MAALVSCPGCKALVPDIAELRARNLYVLAAPGCFAAYAEVIGNEASDPRLTRVHMLSADVYPAQHPGVPGRQSSQSVWVHLVGLCLSLEHGFDGVASARAKARLASPDAAFDWLEPPESRGELTILDVLDSAPDRHAEMVDRWASSVWQAWSIHQAAIRARAKTLL